MPCENFLSGNCDLRVWKENRGLPKDLHRLGKALARGSDFKRIVGEAMNCPGLKKAIEDYICSEVNDECKKLCSKKDASLLRSATKDNMFNFSWETVGKELADKAPFFLRLLLALPNPKSLSQNRNTPWCLCSSRGIVEKPRQGNELGASCYQHDSQGWEDL